MPAKQRLIIIGAGGFGRELLAWALDAERTQALWSVGGFVDDDPEALVGFSSPRPLLGAIDDHEPREDDRFVCAIGNPRRRLTICEELKRRAGQFATVVHPSATVAASAALGEGCVLCPGAVVTADATIGQHVILNVHASVGHDARVGPGCTLSGHADVTGRATLGRGVFLGSHAVVLPGAEVGDFAVVGAGSVVLRRVHAGTTVFGVPARKVSGFGGSGASG